MFSSFTNQTRLVALLAAAMLAGCASSPPASLKVADDVKTYKKFVVSSLSITSDEEGDGAKEANDRLKTHYATKMNETISAKLGSSAIYKAAELAKADGHALIVEEDIHVHYGSRALRYWVGFGAGKGSATLTLRAKDNATGTEKYSDVRVVELSMGAFGGSFEDMIKNNVEEQIQQFSKTSL